MARPDDMMLATRRWRSCLCLIAGLAACASHRPSVPYDDGVIATEPMGHASESRPVCITALTPAAPDGRPGVVMHCQFLADLPMTLARRDGAVFLRDLARPDIEAHGVADDAIRATEEYRSYMDPRNVWQWRDRVTTPIKDLRR